MTTNTLTTFAEYTASQHGYLVDLAANRPNWFEKLDGELRTLVADVLLNEAHIKAESKHLCKALDRKLASKAISALLGIPKSKTDTAIATSAPAPVQSLKQVATKWIEQAQVQGGTAALGALTASATAQPKPQPTPLERLRRLIATFPDGKNVKFALRNDAGVWEFFGLDTVTSKYTKSSYRQFRRLIGAPGDWHRGYLGVGQQLKIAQRILAMGWEQAGRDYATEHGRCFRCDAHLSDTRSIAAKVGKDCADALGWAW